VVYRGDAFTPLPNDKTPAAILCITESISGLLHKQTFFAEREIFSLADTGRAPRSPNFSIMSKFQDDEQFQAEFRAKLYSSQVDSGLSLPQLADKLGLQPTSLLGDYFKGKMEMPVTLLHRYARLVDRPIWWFFGEQPSTISIEGAQNALTNVSRARVYLDAVEAEFRSVLKGNKAFYSMEDSVAPAPVGQPIGPVVVDFAPYLARARAILEAEAECTEDSEEVFEESVEMIAHRLYSIEMATSASREFVPASQEG